MSEIERPTGGGQPAHARVSDGLEELKFREEIAKLEGEKQKLISENSRLGKFTRVALPIVSGVIAAFGGLIGITYQSQQTKARDQEIFLKLLELATKGDNEESRIAGIGGLVQYWQGPFQTTVAQTLAATLMAEGPKVGQPLRMAAANAIGEAICEKPSAVSPWCVPFQAESAATIREILYGNGKTGRNGTITRIQKYLVEERKTALASKPPDQKTLDSIEPKLQATREAIRQNWENLENGLSTSMISGASNFIRGICEVRILARRIYLEQTCVARICQEPT